MRSRTPFSTDYGIPFYVYSRLNRIALFFFFHEMITRKINYANKRVERIQPQGIETMMKNVSILLSMSDWSYVYFINQDNRRRMDHLNDLRLRRNQRCLKKKPFFLPSIFLM